SLHVISKMFLLERSRGATLPLTEKREISKFTSEFSPAASLRLGLTFGLVRGMPIGTSLL
ncbi:MAG TPA: hypothetical protein VFS84_05885, partial [Candidatus Binatia bacterium]|nr:hypothetical protein [Candidatus Binatia bacterium]